ncbi:MAG TPA: DUF2147 domain-containing protein [Pseudolabrys sp.]|jgi:uncharacterized protein (DUF2147 family)
MKFVCAAVIGLSFVSSAALAANAEGIWLSEDGGTKVHISNCGGRLCGSVMWLEKPNDPGTSRPKTDKHNPDPAKRVRPLLGLQVVQGLTPNGPDKWSGQIYNADDGNTYKASLQVQGPRNARVEGCVLAVLCKGQTWTRSN